ncbi:MAG TPA: hypothetical protein VKY57_02050 [Chitinispirillaceae bacterium]|nr:hypothetical protein [Chitinispirillaceae bacterium]
MKKKNYNRYRNRFPTTIGCLSVSYGFQIKALCQCPRSRLRKGTV